MDFIDHRSNATFQFKISSSSERAKIDDSGNLLVGKSSTSIGTVGAEVRGVGQLWATRDGGTPAALNRLTSWGELQAFYKDGVKVGSIQAQSGDLTIGHADTGFRFLDGSDAIIPWNITGNTNRDAAIDLGSTSNRFADLHLSGAANVGGNATITGDLYVSNGQIFLGTADSSSGHVNAYELMTFNIDTDNDDTNRYFKWTTNASSGSGTQLMYLDESGDLTVSGNLTVQGTQTSLEVATLQVEDKNIVLNYGTGDTSGSADGAGITIQDAVDASNDATILWNATNDKFVFSHAIDVTGVTDTDGITSSAEIDVNLAAEGKYFEGGSGGVRQLSITSGTNTSAHAKHTFDIASSNGKYVFAVNSTDRLSVDSSGIDVTGTITADNNLTIQNSSAYGSIELGGVSGGFIDIKRPFSDDYDLRLIAEGDGGVINVASGELTIQRAGSAKLATTSTGIAVTGDATFADNGKAIFGAGSDLQIYHDGGASYVQDTGTGALYLQGDGGVNIRNAAGTENKAVFASDGAVTLYHNNAVKFATSSTGIDVTGTITFDGGTTSADLNFGDNDKAIFGAGSDLQIYHDGTDSYITDTTGGNLFINEEGAGYLMMKGSDLYFRNPSNADMIHAQSGGYVKLYHNASEKLATTSTGIDVTGTAVTDGLTVDTAIATSTASFRATTNSTTIGQKIGSLDFFNGTTNAAGTIEVRRASGGNAYSDMALMASANGNRSNQLLLSTNGDISFYEDTGTTAKLFWDASAERLGIGASAPGSLLELEATGSTVFDGTATDGQAADGTTLAIQNLSDTNNTFSQILFRNRNASKAVSRIASLTDSTGTEMAFVVENNGSPAEVLRLEKTGFAGLGTAAPAAKLDIVDTSADVQMRVYKNDGTKNTRVTLTADDSGAKIHYRDADNAGALRFNNNLGEVMRITANTTRVGIGTSSPATPLDVTGGVNSSHATFSGQAGRGLVISTENTLNNDDGVSYNAQTSSGKHLFKTNGTERLRIDSSGRVGIGTSPSDELHVYASSGGATLKIESNTANAYDSSKLELLGGNLSTSEIVLGDASDADVGKIIYRHDGNSLAFNVNAAERMRLTSSGQLALGTTTPEALLDVRGNTQIRSATDGEVQLRIRNTSTGTNSVAQLYLDGQGNNFYLKNWGDGTTKANATEFLSTAGSSYFIFSTANAERMRLDASGNLLVGKTSASSAVHGGEIRATGQVVASVDGSWAGLFNRETSDGEILRLKQDDVTVGTVGTVNGDMYLGTGDTGFFFSDSGNYIMPYNTSTLGLADGLLDLGRSTNRWKDLHLSGTAYIDTAVGIGTSPDRVFHVSRSSASVISGKFESASTSGSQIVFVDADTTTNDIQVRIGSDANDLVQYAGGSERLRINSSGNASLGTATPLYTAATRTTFTINGLGSSNLSFGANGTGYGNIFVASNEMNIGTQTSANPLKFVIGGSEKARLDGSGNLLVGKTAADTATVGAAVFNYGMGAFTRASSHALDLNRTTSDGSIINLRKNNTTVGTVGTIVGYLTIGTSDTGIIFNDDYNAVYPWNVGTNGGSDGLLDLGVSDRRWKDIYLKGNMNFLGGTNDAQYIKFGDSDDDDIGNIFYYHGNNNMVFTTNASEAFRVDGSGNLLVGKTASNTGVAGMELRPSIAVFTADGNRAFQINRLNSDGELQRFIKDGSTVGSIGTQGGDLNIGTGACGVQFVDGVPALYPWSTTSNATSDNAIDLGDSGARFKDAYLSGTAYIDTAVGIGISSPAAPLAVQANSGAGAVALNGRSSDQIATLNFYASNGTTSQGYLQGRSDSLRVWAASGDYLSLGASGAERTRIDSSGNQLWGKTSADNTTQGIRFLGSSGFMSIVRSNGTAIIVNRIDGDGTLMEFRTNGTTRGSISISGSTTSYNTTSDERLKHNIEDADDAGAIVDSIQVRKFDWIDGGEHQRYGMVAQELGTVAPEAVSVPDDAEEMQSVDYSKLVPMLVKEIQSLRARVAQLEGEN